MLLLHRSCKTSCGDNTEVEGFTIVYRGGRERERAFSFFSLRKWMCECFTLHLLGLHRFVTTLCTCVTPLVPEEWNQIASCLCDLPCRFLDQFCRLLQFSVSLIHFCWAMPVVLLALLFFSPGGSNATFSLLHCSQISTCLLDESLAKPHYCTRQNLHNPQ